MEGAAGKKRFADAVVSRFGKSMGPPAPDSEPDGDEGDEVDKDGENGAMFRAAFKSGDNKALCEAIRRIAG
jgi:hypothetical protein